MITQKPSQFLKRLNQFNANQNYLNGIFSGVFVLCSSYLIYAYEYDAGNFLYYFFKAEFFYAQFNKMILPLGYWFLFALYFLATVWFRNRSFKEIKIVENIRLAIFFHLYLLALTHWGEILPEFSLFPINLPPFPRQSEYEYFIITLGFFFYYGYGWALVFSKSVKPYPITWLIIPCSFCLPFLFIPIKSIFYFLLISSGVALWLWKKWIDQTSIIREISVKNIFMPFLILLISLCYRLWYAVYFDSLGDIGLGLSADGKTYYNSALAFADGRIQDVDFYHAPFYAFYLSIFLIIFGQTPSTLFYTQAIIGAFSPVIIFFIGKHLFNQRVASIAALLVATSQLSIHHAIVSHRIDPTLLILPGIILICLKNSDQRPLRHGMFLGLLSTALFYLAQEMLPIITILIACWTYLKVKTSKLPQNLKKSFIGFLIGIILTATPINFIFYTHFDKWIPLGRDTNFFLENNKVSLGLLPTDLAKQELEKIGFDLVNNPQKKKKIYICLKYL